MLLNRNSKTPLYEQLKLSLQDQIMMGEFAQGVLLPTEIQLCEKYNVSRITVRKALEELARSGLIERVQGKGTIVKKRKFAKSQMEIRGYKGALNSQGFDVSSRLLEKNIVSSQGNEKLITLFRLSPASMYEFWRFRRLRYLNGEPSVVMTSYVRKELGDKMLDHPIQEPTTSFYELLEKITNRPIVDNEAIISAVAASPEIAKLLHTQIGTPLIWFQGVSYIDPHIPIEVNYSFYLGEKFQFQARYYRTQGGKINKEQI
ncbi:MAG: GntR family transcriptional regulator [Anaerolineales bacterium]|nr:GntR family transcriptional regulator [Anaerolineales bacterium]HEY61927.1 GntR family transcriptional regulator [Anaerolineae bacterium]